MGFKCDLFYSSLLIFYIIDVGRASSEDESNRLVEARRHKWTTDEELKLIFLDVFTDTGEPKHFDRIKREWRKEYPKSNVTDDALRCKVRKLREESMEEVSLRQPKKNFKWDEELERELIDVSITTYPYLRDATISIGEEWKRRHPEFQAEARTLMRRVQAIFRECRTLKCKAPGMSRGPLYVVDPEKVREIRHHWTDDEVAMLLHFHNLTDTGEPNHFGRIKLMWREKYPNSNLTDNALGLKIRKLRRSLRNKGERRKYLRWTPEEERVLLDTYLNTYPYQKNVSTTFEETWKQRMQGGQMTRRNLVKRVRELIRQNKYPEYNERVFFEKNPQSRHREGVELSHAPKLKIGRSRGLASGNSGGDSSRFESRAESSKTRSQERNKYIPEMKSLRKIPEGQEEAEQEKRHGKAPMVYASDESALSSPAMTTGDSE